MKTFPIFLLLTILTSSAADPSAAALRDPQDQKKLVERYRILTDLDGDGIDDLLLSGAPSSFGKMGGSWTVYLNRKGSYVSVGDITAHPKAISIEPDHARNAKDAGKRVHARIWVYLRGGAGAGSFGYYRVGEKSVEKLQSLELHPGDAGTTLGNALYAATFKTSPIPFRLELSTTGANGTVQWGPSKN